MEMEEEVNEDDGRNVKKKSKGGFHAMKLSAATLAGIPFKQPTPIQRKTIPLALLGRDVVGMARTGSGKTAAFVIPIIERLANHSQECRCIILSPTRELAQQTYKVAKTIGKSTNLRFCLLQGGDSMEAQFDALAAFPDVLIATPGRLAHLLLETSDFSLSKVEILVVDEADRVFELGFAGQLKEILSRTPESRQTLLFSATLPKQLAEFARASLKEPELIRLDTDIRVSETLKLAFIKIRPSERIPALIHILSNCIDCQTQSTIIFCATKNDVEFVGTLLRQAEIVAPPRSTAVIKKKSYKKKQVNRKFDKTKKGDGKGKDYNENDDDEDDMDYQGIGMAHGSMDQVARTNSLEKFRAGEVKIFVVTDLAARGLDIPHVNNVINFDFPDKSKLFVHRVGRAARQGRVGTAFSLVSTDETAYLFDVLNYLGKNPEDIEHGSIEDRIVGCIPQALLDENVEWVTQTVSNNAELEKLLTGAENAKKMYVRTRQEPSKKSVRLAKTIKEFPIHPLFVAKTTGENQVNSSNVISTEKLSHFRPKKTTFEIEQSKGTGKGPTTKNVLAFAKTIRSTVEAKRQNDGKKVADNEDEDEQKLQEEKKKNDSKKRTLQTLVKKARLSSADRKKLKKGVEIASSQQANPSKKEVKATPAPGVSTGAFRDEKFYISHTASENPDVEFEAQLKVNRVTDAILDLKADDTEGLANTNRSYQWDKRKKKYIQSTMKDHVQAKRMKSEIAGMELKNPGEVYEKWSKKNKKRIGGTLDRDENITDVRKLARVRKESRSANTPFAGGRRIKEEVKNEEQIAKERKGQKKLSERLAERKNGSKKKRVKAGADAKINRIGKQKPKAGKFTRSKVIGGNKGGNKGGKGRKKGR